MAWVINLTMSSKWQDKQRKTFTSHDWQRRRYFGRPPFHRWGPRGYRQDWHNKRRFLFFRLAWFFGLAVLFFLAGMAGLAFLLTRLLGGEGQATFLIWMLGCGLALAIPLLAGAIAIRSFRGMVDPLARVMAAADEVAEGDFSVRVPERGSGEFGKLARSFNRMVEELERTDQQRRNLTADVAHELRTPIHIIQGNLEGIADGLYQPDEEQIGLLLNETQQLSRLVEDLRTLTLAEAGQLPMRWEQVDLGELLADVMTSFSGQAAAAGVVLDYAVSGEREDLQVQGDAGRLDQVLSNLVANALEHTPSGGAIRMQAAPDEGKISIKVSDNGKGIPEQDLPFVFDRFWRGESERRSSSGLGLAIAKQLVRAHGGSISVVSELNRGTTFTLDLPR
jgi:signal transduction histidine kinase